MSEHTPDGIAEAFGVPYTTLAHGRLVPNVERVYQKRNAPQAEVDLLPSDGDTHGTHYGEECLVAVRNETDEYGQPLDERDPRGWTLMRNYAYDYRCGCGCEQVREQCWSCNKTVGEVRQATSSGRTRDHCLSCADEADTETVEEITRESDHWLKARQTREAVVQKLLSRVKR